MMLCISFRGIVFSKNIALNLVRRKRKISTIKQTSNEIYKISRRNNLHTNVTQIYLNRGLFPDKNKQQYINLYNLLE